MNSLCPSSRNQLGKGVFPPEDEALLIEEGYVFAAILPTKRVSAVLVCKRPIRDAVTSAQIDAIKILSRTL